MTDAAVRDLPNTAFRKIVHQYGENTHSSLTLYGGFDYLGPETLGAEAAVAFCNTPRTWLGGAEPFCAEDAAVSVFEKFAQSAKSAGKGALFLPVRRSMARAAVAAGYGAMQFGCEPMFDFTKFDPRIERVETACLLFRRGARVREFRPDELDPEEFRELDRIRMHWIETRSLPALKYVNQADPWVMPKIKRYFVCEHGGHVSAFLAAIPFARGEGWYFVDVLRSEDSKAGTTELLVLEAMRNLKAGGARFVSLGVATLSGIDPAFRVSATKLKTLRWMPALMRTLREKGDILFRFKLLHKYKMKFGPTSVEPVYIVYYPPRFQLAHLFSILHALFGTGIVLSLYTTVRRAFAGARIDRVLGALVRPGVIPAAIPKTWLERAWSQKVTLGMVLVNVWVFFATTWNSGGVLSGEVAARHGFSIANVGRVDTWVTSGFLHESLFFLCANLVLFLFCGLFESLFGGGWTVACYATGLLLANPIFAIAGVQTFAALGLSAAQVATHTHDTGASLGILSCIGGWIAVSKNRRFTIAALFSIVVGLFFLSHQNFWAFNHLVAAGIGYLVMWKLFR